ncbi:6-phosphogluconolactonase [Oceaniovalibus guishaninsula JLT2003]|uniref:6-phosphogluconolactonase n=1 Tax=Oceaniovalibus guishaninsula JLT2003 TaxID=1231392 RepID=K2HGJ9_9RHOB|nr:6-phosphogluconolactonase [Oceaniovalibus guishaninsula]EKE45562.1 6-phosphogluconolactonase [Oceaniovalibus guishaninsula JLT2003]
MKLIEYPDAEMMMMRVADILASEISGTLAAHDRATLAVPGGSTPGPVFDILSGIRLPWDRVHVMLTDERQVPADHPRSNERLLRERLLRDRAAAATFVPLDPANPEALADELPLSILLLGMGADSHTASLFPRSPQLEATLADDAPPVMRIDPPEGLEGRVTLTGPVLRGAMRCHVLITGDAKRAALDTALDADPLDAPIAVVLDQANVHWARS